MTQTNNSTNLKKSKKIGKLELVAAGVLGVGAVITGLSLDRETLNESLVAGGLLAGGVSTIAGYSILLIKQVLQDYPEKYKKNNRDEIGLESKYKYD